MNVIYLAAGKGSRLGDLTTNRPKCTVQYKENTMIIEQSYNTLKEYGITNFSIVGGYLYETLKMLTSHLDLNYIENKKFDSTNMVYSLSLALDQIKDNENYLIVYGDIIFDKNFISTLNKNHPVSLLSVSNWRTIWSSRFSNPLEDVESFKRKGNYLLELGKKEKSLDNIHGQFSGVIFFHGNTLRKHLEWFIQNNIKDCMHNMYFTDFLNIILHNEPIYIFDAKGDWAEFDSPNDIAHYLND